MKPGCARSAAGRFLFGKSSVFSSSLAASGSTAGKTRLNNGDLTRRVEVYDHNFNPPRLVRKCGYQKCLRCREPFWSPHCTGIRLCNVCKGAQAEPVSKPGPKEKPGPKAGTTSAR
jgi:hypothetical protein